MYHSNKWVLAPLALALTAALALSARADQPKADAQDRANDQDRVQGKVQSVSADHTQILVRDDDNRDWAFQLSRDARVRVGDRQAQAADLKEGDRVTVSFRRVAREVHSAQGGQGAEFAAGRVQSAGNNRIVLRGHDGQERTFQVAQDAKVRVGDKEGDLSQVKQGDHAVVAFTKQGDQAQARQILAAPADQATAFAAGQVERVAADRNQIVLKDQDGREHAFQLGQDARVRINDKEAKASDLQEGDQAAVAYWRVADEVNGQRADK